MDFLLLLPLLSVCLLSCSGTTSGATVVKVREGSEAVLPCFIKRDITRDVFDWKKDGQTEVFFYDDNGRNRQGEEFKGRVSHFPDQLKSGDASIVINNTKLSDSGTYTCDYSPEEPNRQTFTIDLVVSAVVRVNVGSEAVLPCFIRPERDITRDVFDWKKDGQTDVFFHEVNGRTTQGEKFKGRVSHFDEQLQFGNASIRMRKTTTNDSGNYTCDFSPAEPNRQTFNIELVVGACRKPSVTTLEATRDWVILKCEVQGVSPETKVEWKDSSGNNITTEEPKITERGGSYDIILQTTVTKTDNYHCVVTQGEICHQVSDETAVFINGPEPPKGACRKPSVTTLEATRYWEILKCEVQRVSPETKVEWKDSDGNILSADETWVPKRGGSYDIILNTTVTKTDKYHCVVTQENICHQVSDETAVFIPGPEPTRGPEPTTGSWTGWIVGGVFAALIVVLFVLYIMRHRIRRFIKGRKTKEDKLRQPSELKILENCSVLEP